MILSLFYLAVSLFGLGFLVFIHEWGHFWVGRKMGMKVETFSIGFGKPIKTWKSNDVLFQIGSIPFGGFVKFKGLDGDRSSSDGFYSVPFYKRIFVAFAGPLANLILAFLVFVIIYLCGGRTVDFMEKNPYVGFLRKEGTLYKAGLREGDKITSINNRPFSSFQDFMVEKTISKGPITLQAEHFPLFEAPAFSFSFKEGGYFPGNFLIFESIPNIVPKEMAYLQQLGLEKGDRLLTLNGQPLFSKASLVELLQELSVLIYVERQNEMIAIKVPKIPPSDIKMNKAQKGELTDWMHGSKLKSIRYFIPYDLSQDLVVEGACEYLNNEAFWQLPTEGDPLSFEGNLQKGDKIFSVNGITVCSGTQFIEALDRPSVHVIAQKRTHKALPLDQSLEEFWAPFMKEDFKAMFNDPKLKSKGEFLQFNIPVIRLDQLKLSEAEQESQQKRYDDEMQRIGKIKDPKQRNLELKEMELNQKRYLIGGLFGDQPVSFNPSPWQEMKDACQMTFKTLSSLFKGALSPKQLSGPVAIVGVMQHGAKKSVTEGLYYFAVISINLALFNLLPLPVLDGGHICFALYEGIFRRPVNQKLMERITFVFVILLVSLLLYATYNDILRFIKGLF